MILTTKNWVNTRPSNLAIELCFAFDSFRIISWFDLECYFVYDREVYADICIDQRGRGSGSELEVELQGLERVKFAWLLDFIGLFHEVDTIIDRKWSAALVASDLGNCIHVSLSYESVAAILECS